MWPFTWLWASHCTAAGFREQASQGAKSWGRRVAGDYGKRCKTCSDPVPVSSKVLLIQLHSTGLKLSLSPVQMQGEGPCVQASVSLRQDHPAEEHGPGGTAALVFETAGSHVLRGCLC